MTLSIYIIMPQLDRMSDNTIIEVLNYRGFTILMPQEIGIKITLSYM